MKDLDLTSLRYFVAACETGNITRAAELENIVASAVSKRLTQLEHDLGVPLLQRQRRGVGPTPAGEMLLEHSRANSFQCDPHRAGHGQLRPRRSRSGAPACNGVIDRGVLPDDVAAFMKNPAHREIHVDIEEP
jgi:DNA-binding transcriptional LysR family regulator